MSKNYGLKIPVRVRVCARMYARAYDCQDSTGHTTRTTTRTRTPPEHTTGKERNAGKHKNKIYYYGEIHTQKMKKS